MSRWSEERLSPDAYPRPGLDLPVLYNDLDTNGHLNNVALGRYFEHARVRALGGLRETQEEGHFLAARVAIDYVSEGQLGDLHVRTRTARIGRSSVTVEQGAWQDGRVVGLAEVVLTYVVGGRPSPVPEKIRARVQPSG